MSTASSSQPIRSSLRSFLMFGFSSSSNQRLGSSRPSIDDSQADATLVRRSSRINVNVAPVLAAGDSEAPEIRKYKKRFGSDVLCASLWGL